MKKKPVKTMFAVKKNDENFSSEPLPRSKHTSVNLGSSAGGGNFRLKKFLSEFSNLEKSWMNMSHEDILSGHGKTKIIKIFLIFIF